MIEEIKKYLKENLSEFRFLHVLSVCEMATELATIYNVDVSKAELAALLHDCTKEMDQDKQLVMLDAADCKDEYIYKVPPIRHAYTGAYFAKTEFGITDESILKAIEYHTIGNPKMDDVAKVVYVADAIEARRHYDGVEELRAMVGTVTLDELVIAICEHGMEQFTDSGKTAHKDTLNLLKLLKIAEKGEKN